MTEKTLHSYSEKSKSTRMARALLDEGYDHNYVIKALTDKGYNAQEAQELIKAGRIAHYEQKISQSRGVAIVMGILWGIVVALFFFTNDDPQSNSIGQPRSFYMPGRFILYAAAIFGVALFTWIYYWTKAAKLRRTL